MSASTAPEIPPRFQPFQSFDEAADEALRFLKDTYGFGAWMITRTVGEEWIMLRVRDDTYGVKNGEILRWSDSFCYRMVREGAPNIAPRSSEVAAYRDAPIGSRMEINAYIGYPLVTQDGELFGTLCAIDPLGQAERIAEDSALLQLLARFLSGVLHTEMQSMELSTRIAKLEQEVSRDGMTGLLNRSAWDRLLLEQDRKCDLLGEPASVVVIDLNDLKQINDTEGHEAGDRYITLAADSIRSVARSQDAVARLGGDEFGILLEGSAAQDPGPILERLQDVLQQAGIAASVGWARRKPGLSLSAATAEADARMYDQKRRGKAGRT